MTYVEGGPDRYVNASEVVMAHARNACKAVLDSIAHEVVFDPEEAPSSKNSSAASSHRSPHAVTSNYHPGSTTTATAAAPNGGAYVSTAAAFSANYAADHSASPHDNFPLPSGVPHVPQGLAMAIAPPVDVDVDDIDIGFQPAPADARSTTGSGVDINPGDTSAPAGIHDTTMSSGSSSDVHEGVPRPASPQTAAESQPAAALAMSAEMRELLSKAADHCARSGTFPLFSLYLLPLYTASISCHYTP